MRDAAKLKELQRQAFPLVSAVFPPIFVTRATFIKQAIRSISMESLTVLPTTLPA
jgi:hypothetical protein